jgi:hypothetical protein
VIYRDLREVSVDRFVRANLGELGLGADRRVHVHELGPGCDADREDPLGPRHAVDRDGFDRFSAGGQDRERPRAARVKIAVLESSVAGVVQ